MTIYNKIDKFVTELFIIEQNKRDIASGDITPELDLELSQIQQNLAEKIEEILDYQVSLEPNIVELAASAGQYNMNGIPLIFTLFQYENQKDNTFYLKIDMETTVDEEFYGEEYHKTLKILEDVNKNPYSSYSVKLLNQIINCYTHDFAEFEHNEEDNEWHGNIF